MEWLAIFIKTCLCFAYMYICGQVSFMISSISNDINEIMQLNLNHLSEKNQMRNPTSFFWPSYGKLLQRPSSLHSVYHACWARVSTQLQIQLVCILIFWCYLSWTKFQNISFNIFHIFSIIYEVNKGFYTIFFYLKSPVNIHPLKSNKLGWHLSLQKKKVSKMLFFQSSTR